MPSYGSTTPGRSLEPDATGQFSSLRIAVLWEEEKEQIYAHQKNSGLTWAETFLESTVKHYSKLQNMAIDFLELRGCVCVWVCL